MPTTKPRFTITVDEELYRQIEDYRFEGRYETKSDAVSALLAIGLKAVREETKKEKD